MTIEEKAKAYDEAIIKAKEWKSGLAGNGDIKTCINELFPELAESENEKIRKDIIHHIEFGKEHNIIPSERASLWIAWLEKQGELKLVESTDLKTWKYIVDAVLTEWNGIGQYLDNPQTETIAKKLQERFGTIEQKPYPVTLDKAIELYYFSYGNGKGGFDNLSLEKFKDIVKTFVNDYGEQKPVEWSEKDESLRNDAIYYVSLYANNIARNESEIEKAVKCENWLKFLRPQKQWKPSEEQMEALRVAKAYPSSERREILETLYEDLEQLKAL